MPGGLFAEGFPLLECTESPGVRVVVEQIAIILPLRKALALELALAPPFF